MNVLARVGQRMKLARHNGDASLKEGPTRSALLPFAASSCHVNNDRRIPPGSAVLT